MSKIFAEILLPLVFNQFFTYISQEEVEAGDVVRVEFGKKQLWGVVMAIKKTAPEKIPESKLKKVLEKNSYLKLTANQLKFIEITASYNIAARGLVLKAFIGILNSDKTKKIPELKLQKIAAENFSLKKLLPKQQEIFERLERQIAHRQDSVALLDGITGSGKTEIYFAVIAKILAQRLAPQKLRPQILILLPEIALTAQLLLRFEEQFAFRPLLWHSKISAKDKREIFYGIIQGSVQVLIGARSALFLPFKNLQLIIIDEEHDASFKQEDIFKFHARDMAIVKARLESFPVILSSATPGVETYNNAVLGKYYHLILEQKFGQKNAVELIDLRLEKRSHNKVLAQKLQQEIARNLSCHKQTLLFLNRRGYNPVTVCKACGKRYECPNCDFHLVLHKAKEKLLCHYCNHQEKLILECKFCGQAKSLTAVGFGVEKLAEEVKNNFPDARIALVTSDNITSFSDADKLVKQILHREIDIIIGTQMISKGHDFPDLTLVGIIDADSLLYSSELRALEKAYQLLTQVIGRAGRKNEAGKVLIQTYNPQNLLFEKIIQGHKKSFYEFELTNRKAMNLPPFSKLARFDISAFLASDAKNFAKKLISHFPASDKIELFGPAPAAIKRLKNRYHFWVNLKVMKKVNLQKLISDVTQKLEIPASIRFRIDIDPLN
jgi:primosomal protein N' (replication factor Y)